VAHAEAKATLLAEVERRTSTKLDAGTMTIGFARRATGYKRADLLYTDEERLRRIIERVGPLQLVYSGKAHSRDTSGKAAIERIFSVARELKDILRVVYLEEYDMTLAAVMVAGVDLWLNNPLKPLEASGTSGMKAALNGVPSLSVLDGWWLEGWLVAELDSLYGKLENAILPMFYDRPRAYADVMRSAMSHNGSFFNAQRMVSQYVQNVYEPGIAPREEELVSS